MHFLRLILVLLFNAIKCDERGARVRRIVGGEPAELPPEDDPVVFTTFSGKTARVLGVRDYPHYVFRGIRYGHPPLGKERFLRPRQYYLQGFENATQYPPPCVQPVPGQDKVIGDEDCLFLNVFTPTLPTGSEGLPVIVWIHGGGFRYGSASQYGVRDLVGKRVVVVTIQYRLGSLGFLSTGTKSLPGNVALWDMVLAVQWTRNYIGFFGGNPNRIVVMGHGTGASCAIMISLSKMVKGLTSGVVAMSGSSLSNFAADDAPNNTALQVAEANGCPVASELTMIRCLQKVSPDSIIKIDSTIEFQRIAEQGFIAGLAGKLGPAPVYEGRSDGRFLPPVVEKEPLNDPETSHKKIPLLTGITKDETKRACRGQFRKEILAKLKAIPGFLYQFLVKGLQKTLGIKSTDKTSKSLFSVLDPDRFRNYIEPHSTVIHEALDKIAEATNDALFNVPAFLTAGAWSKQDAPSFLYRFEHVGRRKKGYSFLKGLPLVGNSSQTDESNDTVAHGDELAYLFDPQDVHGRSLDSTETNEEDEKVRDIFTQMISDFARHGKVRIGGKDVKPFSLTDNNYIQINPNPKVSNNFRYCELALWLGLVERLKTASCQLLTAINSNVQTLVSQINPAVDVKSKIEDTVSKPLDVFGGGESNNKNKSPFGFIG